MERTGIWNWRRLAIVGAALLTLALILAFWMREVVHEMVVLPISYLFYTAGILINATPQLFFWLAIVLIGFWVAYRSLQARARLETQGRLLQEQADLPASGRMAYWANKVNLLRQYRSSYYQGGFHSALGRLLVELLAQRYRLTNVQVERRLRADEIDLPEDVREYARYFLLRPETGQTSLWRQTLEDIVDFLHVRLGINHRLLKIDTQASRASQRVESVIKFMEDELEVPHEHFNQ